MIPAHSYYLRVQKSKDLFTLLKAHMAFWDLYLSVYVGVHGVGTCFNRQASGEKTYFHYSRPCVLCQLFMLQCPPLHHPVVSLHVVCVYFCVYNILTRCVCPLSTCHCVLCWCEFYTATPVLSQRYADMTLPLWGHASPTLCYIYMFVCPIQSLCGYYPRQCSGTSRSF